MPGAERTSKRKREERQVGASKCMKMSELFPLKNVMEDRRSEKGISQDASRHPRVPYGGEIDGQSGSAEGASPDGSASNHPCPREPATGKPANMPYPQLQQSAPFFRSQAAIGDECREICLHDYRGRYLVLFFYPLDFTFVCPTEIVAFSDAASKFRDINCEVIACSTDSHYCHLAWVNTPRKEGGLGPMNIPLLSDKTMAISRAYGVLNEDEGYPFRGLFIIDTEGVLRQIIVNDIGVGRSVDEVMRLVQAYQFVDIHGEVCPMGWKPGEQGVKPDVDESKEYFSHSHK